MSVANPYEPHFTADGPVVFVGREDVFAFFRQHLVGAPPAHGLVLIGRAGLGKSAVLHQLERQIDERYRPCIIRLGALDLSGEDHLLAALVEAIHATLEGTGASTYRLPLYACRGGTARPALVGADYLAVTMSALRLRHLLLVFDDAHLLFDAIDEGKLPGDLFAYLADLLAAYDRLALVFALDTTHEDRVLGTELLSDPSLHIRLGELSRADAERLVREPVAGMLDYEDRSSRDLSLAGGHPFLLHSVCRLLFRRSESAITPGRSPPTIDRRAHCRARPGRRDFQPPCDLTPTSVTPDRPGSPGRRDARRSVLLRRRARLAAGAGTP